MHSKEGSKCGQAPLADLVRAYHAAGYAGGVL
ncbi:MAG: histidinol-phosphatase, partial [Ruminococcaceae bacterium]|nr:histidinol-phosphatase [Oscillospiraceae bacterium]